MVILIVAKDQQIIVGTFRGGIFTPHIMCSDDALALEGQQVALTVLTSEPDKVRTHQERKAIEVYCREAAKCCMSAGIDMRAIIQAFRKETEIPVSQYLFKEVVYKAMALAQFGVTSTAKLTSTQPYDVYLWCNQFTSKRLGFSIPWPSNQPNMTNDYE